MKYPYSDDYTPVAPALPVALRARQTGQSTAVRIAIVDTGTDATVVPISMLQTIGARRSDVRQAISLWGGRRQVELYNVDVIIGEYVIEFVDVVGQTDNEELILGRDVLNELRLLLDGPDMTLELLE